MSKHSNQLPWPLPLPLNEQLLIFKKDPEDGIEIKFETEVYISDMEFEEEEENVEHSESQDYENVEISNKSVSEVQEGAKFVEGGRQLQDGSLSVQPALPSKCWPSNVSSEMYKKLIKRNRISNTCRVCSFEHKSMSVMKKHCKQHVQFDQGTKCSYIMCHLCDRRYKHMHHFYKHLNLIHIKKYEFSCDICDKTFISKDTLRVHIKYLHNSWSRPRENRHDCSICMRSFIRENSLQRHLLEVHEGLKYTCDLCGKQFTQKASVKKHLFSVHFKNNNNFFCASCEKSFTVKGSLLRHNERKHKKKYFCNNCMEGFERKSMLIKHFKQSHKL